MSLAVKPASSRQMAYIERLLLELGERKPEVKEELSSVEASLMIGKLISKTQQKDGSNGEVKINEARLGMVMKECYRVWKHWGRDVLGNRRQAFIEDVILTYNLFTEIKTCLEQDLAIATGE